MTDDISKLQIPNANSHKKLFDLRQKISKIDAKIKKLQAQKIELNSELGHVKMLSHLMFKKVKPLDDRPITPRNIGINTAWAAIQHAILDSGINGTHIKDLERFVYRELPNLNPSTFRSYVRRIKEAGKIEKLPAGRWILTSTKQIKRRSRQ